MGAMRVRRAFAGLLAAVGLLIVLVPAAWSFPGSDDLKRLTQLSVPEDVEKQAFEDLMDSLKEISSSPSELPDVGDLVGVGTSPPPGSQDSNPTVKEIQVRLKALNCYTGSVDGQWGPKSRLALRGALGQAQASTGPTRENLDRLKAINKGPDVCADITQVQIRSRARSATRRSKRACLTFDQCMAQCNSGALGRNSGTGCSYICDVEIPLCPR